MHSYSLIKGSPTDTDIQALHSVVAKLDARSRAEAAGVYAERNMWGTSRRLYNRPVFNPSAFRNVHFD